VPVRKQPVFPVHFDFGIDLSGPEHDFVFFVTAVSGKYGIMPEVV